MIKGNAVWDNQAVAAERLRDMSEIYPNACNGPYSRLRHTAMVDIFFIEKVVAFYIYIEIKFSIFFYIYFYI